MSRYPRSLARAIIVALFLLVGLVAPAPAPVTHAAGTFVVTTTLDVDGTACGDPCSLRQAIRAAKLAQGGTITFNIKTVQADNSPMPGYQNNGVIRTWRITLDSGLGALPALEFGTDIDGVSQESANPGVFNPIGPDVIIDGRNLLNRSGITINSPDAVSEVKGLAVVNFNGSGGFGQGVGINVVAGAGHVLQGNFVGIDQQNLPTQVGGNGFAGIWVQSGATGTQIGGQLINQRESNIISNNNLDGIVLQGNTNIVSGNFIGTDYGAFNDLPNQGAGILVYSSTGNIIGAAAGQASTYGNYISGNRDFGIQIDGGRTTEVAGNFIGIGVNQATGRATRGAPNGAGGIEVNSETRDALDNQLGVAGRPRNYISGNSGPGITLRSAGTAGTAVVNNVVGLDGDGQPLTAPNNRGGGVLVQGGATGVTIGGNTADKTNIISANTGNGIFFSAPSNSSRSTNNQVLGNCIGTGTACQVNRPLPFVPPSPYANTGSGIVVGNFVRETTIGGDDAAANTIGYNLGFGVAITGTDVLTTTIGRNQIRYNSQDGIYASGVSNTQIAGTSDQARLVVSDNLQSGIRFANVTRSSVRFADVNTNNQNGISVTTAQTTTLQALVVNRNGANGVLFESTQRDVTIENNTVLTNTLDGITGTGSSTNTIINSNVVRGHNGSGIRWNGPALDTEINGNTVYSNTVLATPEAHGIWLGAGERASITDNRSRGNFNGVGILMGAVDGSFININSEVNRNGLEGIRVTGATDVTIAGNTVLSNTTVAGSLAGIALTGVNDARVSGNTVRGHTATPGIAISGATGITLPSNTVTRNQTGLSVADGFNTAVTGGSYNNNIQHGVLITSTELMTITQGAQLNFNGQSGARILGNALDVRLLDTNVLSNTVNGIQLGADGAGPHPRNVTIQDNTITGNGIPVNSAGVPTVPLPVAAAYQGLGIVFDPEGPPQLDTNPNRDIDPPLEVALSSNGVVTGRVDPVNAAGGCAPPDNCLVQVFRANPTTRDGQGRDKLGQALADATGQFTVTVGTLPAQLALTATDGDGNTSRFGLFTGNPDLTIGPARTANARPGEVITYTHDVVNTGNMTFTNLKLSALSSRGWDQITLNPPAQFSLKPGETKPITVVVKLPTGADQRVRVPGPVDDLTVTVEGSVQFEGQAPLIVKRSVVDKTTVLASVVLEIVPQSLSGVGTPGSTLPYVHAIRNNGNIAATIRASASTDLFNPNSNPPAWVTTVSPTGDITIQPGQQATVEVLVTVPNTSVTAGTVARTTLQITTINPVDATQNRTALDTTTVTLVPAARLQQDEVIDGSAGRTFAIPHRATNLSNGNATFRLAYSSSLGSTVTFRSATQGVTLGANNSFTLGTQIAGAPPSAFDFFADVRVNPNALAGQKDSIIIYLLDDRGNVVGGAFVRDTINVREATIAPRLWLPMIGR
jgi:CSLREA domain-containing protein